MREPGACREAGAVSEKRSTVVSLLVLLAAVSCLACDDEAPGSQTDPASIVLGLGDVAPGYEIGDDSSCGRFSPEEPSERLAAVAYAHDIEYCYRQLEMYTQTNAPEHAPLIETVALVAESENAAIEVLAAAEEFIRYLSPVGQLEQPRRQPEPTDSALVIDATSLVGGNPNQPVSIYLWRQGRVVSYVLVGGLDAAANGTEALRLAILQHERIEAPEPPREVDTDDAEAPLDRPNLGVPIYWVGPVFEPGNGLPAVQIARSHATGGPMGPGNHVDMEYEEPANGAPGFNIYLWKPDEFEAFLEGPLGELLLDHACTTSEEFALPEGRFVLYRAAPQSSDCAEPTLFVGHIYFDDVVATVHHPHCFTCFRGPFPYNSEAGVRAIAEALQPR